MQLSKASFEVVVGIFTVVTDILDYGEEDSTASSQLSASSLLIKIVFSLII